MAEHKLSYTASEIDNRLRRVDDIPVVDSEFSTTSTNPVQNKVITSKINSIESSLNQKANTSAIPTKTSQLTNNSGFLTSIPSEYVTETELTNKGYATQASVTALSNRIDNLPTGGNITVDSALSSTSTNPVQNKVIYEEFSKLEEALVKDFSDINDGFNEVFGEIEAINNEIDNLSANGGKTLISEFDLNSSNLTASTTEAGRYSTSTELQETLANVFTTLHKGFDVLAAEFTIDTDIIGGVCTYDLYDDTTNGTINFTQISGICSNLSEDLVNFTLLKNYFLTNMSENLNNAFSAGLSVHVKLYTLSGGGSGGGTPYYKDGVVIFDGDVTTELSDGIAGANIETTRVVETSSFDVYIDEVFYPCELKQVAMYGTTMAYLGNFYTFGLASGIQESELANMGVTDTKEPFVMVFNPDDPSMIAFMASEVKTYHVKIEAIKGANKLDSSLIDWAGGGMPSGLPEVTSEDNDKVLVVVNGKWTVASIANGDEVYY